MLLSDAAVVTVCRAGTPNRIAGLRQSMVGFTLIEAMITVGLLAIVMAIAIPGYASYVIRANRTDAMQSLMAAAACQERRYSSVNAYDATACEAGSATEGYTFTVVTSNGNHNFVASATPQGAQTKDPCGVLSINQAGIKNADGQAGSFAATCWTGK